MGLREWPNQRKWLISRICGGVFLRGRENLRLIVLVGGAVFCDKGIVLMRMRHAG
jgi:hypothetical protein